MEYLVVDHADQLDCKEAVVPLELVVYMVVPHKAPDHVDILEVVAQLPHTLVAAELAEWL